jgi:hypothetical protein
VTGEALDTPLAGSVVQRLQRNGTFPLLKRIVLRSIAPLMLQEDAKLGALVQVTPSMSTHRSNVNSLSPDTINVDSLSLDTVNVNTPQQRQLVVP